MLLKTHKTTQNDGNRFFFFLYNGILYMHMNYTTLVHVHVNFIADITIGVWTHLVQLTIILINKT